MFIASAIAKTLDDVQKVIYRFNIAKVKIFMRFAAVNVTLCGWSLHICLCCNMFKRSVATNNQKKKLKHIINEKPRQT